MSSKQAVFAMLAAAILALVAYIGPNIAAVVKFNMGIESPGIRQQLEIEPVGLFVEEKETQGIFAINVESDGFKAVYPQTLTLKEVNDASVMYEGKGGRRLVLMGAEQLDLATRLNSIKDLNVKDKAKIEELSTYYDSQYELMKDVVCATPKKLSIFDSRQELENKLTLLQMKKLLVPQCDAVGLLQIGGIKVIQFASENSDKPRQICSNLYTDTGGVKVIVTGSVTQEEMDCLYRTAIME